MDEKAVLHRLIDTLKEELTDALTGVYLHGSMVRISRTSLTMSRKI